MRYLQFDRLAADRHNFRAKLDADGVAGVLLEPAFDEVVEEARLSRPCRTNDEKFEEVVVRVAVVACGPAASAAGGVGTRIHSRPRSLHSVVLLLAG